MNKLLSIIVLSALMAAPVAGFTNDNNNHHSSTSKTGQYFDDATITTKVKAAIMGEPGLKSLSINVETYNGKVQLSGFVDSHKSVDKAGEKAKSVEGVKSVINSLQVK